MFSRYWLAYSQTVAHLNLVVGLQMVHLVKTLQSDAVHLCNRVHAFASSYNVRSASELFLGTLLLLFQIHHVALGKDILIVSLVIAW